MPRKKKKLDWTDQPLLEEDTFIPKELNPDFIPDLKGVVQAYLYHGSKEEKVVHLITELVRNHFSRLLYNLKLMYFILYNML